MENAVTFHNHTIGKWAGEAGHTIEITVHEENSAQKPPRKLVTDESWSCPRTGGLSYTIRSLTITSGWATYKGNVSGHAPHNLYIVESNHALAFNVTHEWPPKHLEKY